MTGKHLTATKRAAIWQANKERCFYCGEPISYRNLEIDHLIPKATSHDEVIRLRDALTLPPEFTLDDLLNLVPTHHDCNRKKGRRVFSDASLRYYIEIWKTKQGAIKETLNFLQREAHKDNLLAQLTVQIEAGHISIREIVLILEGASQRADEPVSEPLVVCFGVNLLSETIETIRRPGEAGYALSDRLEADLLKALRLRIGRPIVPTEPSQRDGEAVSLRIAFWDFDLDRLSSFQSDPWEILEVAPYASIYSDKPAHLYSRAVEESYSIFKAEKDGCPECGGPVAVVSAASDYGEYAIGTCGHCGWEAYFP